MIERLVKLRGLFPEHGLEALVVTRPENRIYLSGFTGSTGVLVITKTTAYLLTDFRYLEQATAEAPDFQVVQHGRAFAETLRDTLQQAGITNLGFEKDVVSYQQYEEWRAKLNISLRPVNGLVEKLRAVKDARELAAIRTACQLADEAFHHILKVIKPGVSEQDLALELEFYMRQRGASGIGFDIIAASGVRSALPHGLASPKKLVTGELLTLDFGATVNGYNSDITRTVVIGLPTTRQQEIYGIVQAAQEKARQALRPGIKAGELDRLAREMISTAGFGEAFGHSLGHGVGRAVHELPTLAVDNETVLEPGMVVTIEPGIYLPGWGGVRIEDTVVVTATGGESLTNSPRELMTVGMA